MTHCNLHEIPGHPSTSLQVEIISNMLRFTDSCIHCKQVIVLELAIGTADMTNLGIKLNDFQWQVNN